VATQRLVALLRAVNVTGTGMLLMADLRALCEELGFRDVRTYIQSGNVVCSTTLTTPKAKARLETALAKILGKPCLVMLRTADELEATLAANPFPDAPPNRLLVLFLDTAPPATAIDGWKIPGGERLVLRGRELFIHFPEGQGVSKLRLPFAAEGTGRNLNTVRKLLEMARED
jgi:uncharacterized protein (DUF1697 family)